MPGLYRIMMLALVTATLLPMAPAEAGHGAGWCIHVRSGSADLPVDFRMGPLGEMMIFVAADPDELVGPDRSTGPGFDGTLIIIDPNCPYAMVQHALSDASSFWDDSLDLGFDLGLEIAYPLNIGRP